MDKHESYERITIRDVAREAGVAVVSVSRALNGQPGVSDATRERIADTAMRLGYHPNKHARYLKLGSNRNIALMMKGIDNPFFQQMLDTMETRTREHDHLLSVFKVPHYADEVEEAIKLVDEDAVAGIIFLGGNFTHDPAVLRSVPVPYVLSTVGNLVGIPKGEYASVTVDDFAEAGKIVDYLVGLGHQRIALLGVTTQDVSVGRLRTQGYLDALTRAGLPQDLNLVRAPQVHNASPFTLDYGYSLTRELLVERPDVTAIFAEADVMAIGALKAVLDAGLRVPQDMSIFGFDGIPLTRFVHPTLTTLVQPVKQIAEATCDLLFEVMAGYPKRSITVPGTLQLGGSTGAPRTEPYVLSVEQWQPSSGDDAEGLLR